MGSDPILPPDLLHLLSEELGRRLDYSTLYSCIASSRHFGSCGAVASLYRICHTLLTREDTSDALPGDQELPVRRLSALWRSIILSTMGKTMHAYCRHVRSLNLGSLDDLLRDKTAAAAFFSGDLAQFRITLSKFATRIAPLDVHKIVASIGNQIVQHAPLLEEISDPMMVSVISSPSTITEWAPRLQHLRSLEFWDGAVLADENVRSTLYAHCSNLTTLRIYRCSNDDSDSTLAAFIGGLPDNTLQEFRNFNDCHIGTQTCLALNTHGRRLSTLRLALSAEGILALALLQGCTSLHTLSLECSTAAPDLKATQHDVYLEIIAWLQNCVQLKSVTFQEFVSAPDLLTPILLNKDVSLERIEVKAMKEDALYVAKDHHDFHQALSAQSGLEELMLAADSELMESDDIRLVTEQLCSLTNLRDLRLTRISDYFNDAQIISLVTSLPRLEQLFIGGWGITDAVLPHLAKLQNLKLLAFGGMTSFSADGILDFMANLGEGNTNMTLSMLYADPDRPIDPGMLEMLRETMTAKVDGRFEYTLLRDPNVPEFDTDDSE